MTTQLTLDDLNNLTGTNNDNFTYSMGIYTLYTYQRVNDFMKQSLSRYSTEIVDKQIYFWDLMKSQPQVDWTDTPTYDDYYFLCHSISLPSDLSTVGIMSNHCRPSWI